MMSKSAALQEEVERLNPVYIAETQLVATQEILRSFSRRRNYEGLVYWFGFEQPQLSIVTTLIVPRAEARIGCISTSASANAEALRVIVGTPLVLLGQAHSHPGELVDHSPFDDAHTFARFDGMISVVIPFLAKRKSHIEKWGIHRHVNGGFIRIGVSQIHKHLRIIPGEVDLRSSNRGCK